MKLKSFANEELITELETIFELGDEISGILKRPRPSYKVFPDHSTAPPQALADSNALDHLSPLSKSESSSSGSPVDEFVTKAMQKKLKAKKQASQEQASQKASPKVSQREESPPLSFGSDFDASEYDGEVDSTSVVPQSPVMGMSPQLTELNLQISNIMKTHEDMLENYYYPPIEHNMRNNSKYVGTLFEMIARYLHECTSFHDVIPTPLTMMDQMKEKLEGSAIDLDFQLVYNEGGDHYYLEETVNEISAAYKMFVNILCEDGKLIRGTLRSTRKTNEPTECTLLLVPHIEDVNCFKFVRLTVRCTHDANIISGESVLAEPDHLSLSPYAAEVLFSNELKKKQWLRLKEEMPKLSYENVLKGQNVGPILDAYEAVVHTFKKDSTIFNDVAVKHGNRDLRLNSLRDLVPKKWLQGHIMEYYTTLLMRVFPRVKILPTTFFADLLKDPQGQSVTSTLLPKNYSHFNVMDLTKKDNIFNYEYVIAIINRSNSHWLLVEANCVEKTVCTWDPISGSVKDKKWSTAFSKYLADEWRVQYGETIEPWEVKQVPKLAGFQVDGFNCGIHVLLYIHNVCVNGGVNLVTNADINLVRKAMMSIIMTGVVPM
jgi:hypothetical protein